jgi:hypothetical protein
MNSFINSLISTNTFIQALAVSAGGLIGVFATLAFFFLMIFIANKLGAKG